MALLDLTYIVYLYHYHYLFHRFPDITLQWMLIVLKPIKALWDVFLPTLYNIFLITSNDAIEFSTSKLIAPCFISIIIFTVFLSGSIITLPSVSSIFIYAISANSFAQVLFKWMCWHQVKTLQQNLHWTNCVHCLLFM